MLKKASFLSGSRPNRTRRVVPQSSGNSTFKRSASGTGNRAQRQRSSGTKNGKGVLPITDSSKKADVTLLILVGVILVFGLIMLFSASSVRGHQLFGDSFFYVKRQLLQGFFLGGLMFYAMSKIDYHYWKKYAFPLIVFNILLLCAVFIPGLGEARLGAKRWIELGGFSFQPAEMIKMTFLIYLAAWLEKKGKDIHDVAYGLASFLVMLGILVLLIAVAQRDLGTTMVITAIAIVLYFTAGAPLKHIAMIGGGGLVAVIGLIALEPYRINRVKVLFNPALDPTGIGYHVNQALIAVGSGGFFGLGLMHSRQKYNYLPEVATDSIFAIIAEELGFLFAVGVVLLFLVFVLQALRIAKRAPDQFGKLLAVGIATWIGFQAFANIGAMLSLIPLTGIPLPFISHGSSSLIMLLAATGLLVNISKQAK